MGAGVIALGVYGFVATLQPDAHQPPRFRGEPEGRLHCWVGLRS